MHAVAAKLGNSESEQVHATLGESTSIGTASEDILLCSDNAQRGTIQVKLHYNGVGITGARLQLLDYPTGIARLESIELTKHVHLFKFMGFALCRRLLSYQMLL